MNTAEIKQIIEDKFGTISIKDLDLDAPQPWLEVDRDDFLEICQFLRDDERTYFDMLSCLSGIDYGVEQNELGAVYHLASIPHGHQIVLKVRTSRDPSEKEKTDESEGLKGTLDTSPSEADDLGLKGKLMGGAPGLTIGGTPAERPDKVEGSEEFGEPFWTIFTEELMGSGMPAGFLKEVFGEDAPEVPEPSSESSDKKKIRPLNPLGLPSLPSVSSIWKTAEWHEREAFDLLGIWFDDHPDMRRILLPEDWTGYPLRKDYKTEESYHGLKVDY